MKTILCIAAAAVCLALGTSARAEPSGNFVESYGAEWEKRYVSDTRSTIEKGVASVMNGLDTPEQLSDAVEYFCRTWKNWEDSRVFVLQDDRDIDVYGNLYSLRVMCRTLRLAAEDLYEEERSERSEALLEKARHLEEKSKLLASPVAEIIMRQSYSEYLPRRVEIMRGLFGYVDEYYRIYVRLKRM